MSSNCLVFHTYGWISSSPATFLFLIFLSNESSSSGVNGPSLMSNCLLIILVIGSCETFGRFPSRFWKCCFYSFIRSCWFVALAVLFLLLTSFIVCRAILDCLYSTESLILSFAFVCILSVLLGICLLIHFVPFFSFRAFALVVFFLLHLGAVFMSAHLNLTANVSHRSLDLDLCFVGIYFAAASKWALTKFSYSSFGVVVSVFPCSTSNLFLNAITYLSLISLLLRRAQS